MNDDIHQLDSGVFPTSYIDKEGFLENARETLEKYARVLVGRSASSLAKNHKHAMAQIFNNIGLWSGQWVRYLPSPPNIVDILRGQVYTVPGPQPNQGDLDDA